MFKRVAKDEDDAGPPWYGLAECYDFLGRYEEAEAAYEEAHRLEPEDFPLPVRMTRDAFEALAGTRTGTARRPSPAGSDSRSATRGTPGSRPAWLPAG